MRISVLNSTSTYRGGLKYATNESGAWVSIEIDFEYSSSLNRLDDAHTSIAVNSNDKLHIAYSL